MTAFLKYLISSGGPLIGSNILVAIVGLITTLLIARSIEPAMLGAYAAIIGIAQLILAGLGGSMPIITTRTIAQDESEARWLLPTQLAWFIFLAVLLPIFAGIGSRLYGVEWYVLWAVSLASLQLTIRMATDTIASTLIIKGRTRQIALGNMLESIALVSTTAVLLLNGAGVLGLALASLCATLLRTTSIGLAVKREYIGESFVFQPKRLVELLSQSRYLALVQFLYAFGSRLQPSVIGSQSTSLAGYYVMGSRIVDTSQLVISPLMPVVLNRLSNVRAHSNQSTILIRQTILIGTVAGLASAFTVWAIGPSALSPVLGTTYYPIIVALLPISLLVGSTLTTQFLSTILISLYNEQSILHIVIVSAIVLQAGLFYISKNNSLTQLFALAASISLTVLLLMLNSIRLSLKDKPKE